MQTINLSEQKLLLFQKIVSIQNENVLNKLFVIVDKFTKNNNDLSFETWNSIFMEEKNLDEFIPEYDMTLGEYRRKIYQAEQGKSMPISKLIDKLNNYGK